MKKIVEKSMLGRAWLVGTYSDDNSDVFSADGLVQKILTGRGIVTPDAQAKFLNPSVNEYMPNPSVMADMDVAARIIADAIVGDKKIAIYGDYDVDGITATAVFVRFLREIGAAVVYRLPTREGEGYGLNNDAIDELVDDGAELMITVDCGISGVEEVAHATSRGLTVVVTDHHSPDSILPNAAAVVNPKRADDTSGLSYLAGVGVAFMTLVAVRRELKSRTISDELRARIDKVDLVSYLDFVALGTICDTMPLIDLNRAFVATGMRVLGMRGNLGLRILMQVASIKKPSVYAVGFGLGPRLNAAGRLDSAEPALDLLLTDNVLIANDLANKLDAMNKDRIGIQNAIMLRATEIADDTDSPNRCSLFICGDNWHGGVMGIIAGRLKDKYNLPTCVATRSDGMINGSGRSIPGVDLGKIIHAALSAGIISEGGGHAAAAGFSLPVENEDAFRAFLEEQVSVQLNGVVPVREVVADAILDAGAATMDLVNQMCALEPFGQANEEPILILDGAVLRRASVMGAGNGKPGIGAHLWGNVVTSTGKQLAFVGFNMVGTPVGDFLLDDANLNTKIKLLGRLKANEYKNTVSAQFFIEDIAL